MNLLKQIRKIQAEGYFLFKGAMYHTELGG